MKTTIGMRPVWYRLGVLLAFLAGSLPASAAEPFLVKDINPTGFSVAPYSHAQANGLLFFLADDGVHGWELWVSDGTEFRTSMVIDMSPGNDAPVVGSLTCGPDRLLFSADDGVHGWELWISDGTESGTTMVKDINPNGDSSPSGGVGPCNPLTSVEGIFFFVADDGLHGRELWKSDGTEEGTVLVKDIWEGGTSSFLGELTDVNGTLFFKADDGINGQELWKSDGTEAGTVMVKDINPAGLTYILWITAVGDKVFFQGDDLSGAGEELWVSDGTEEGTFMVKDINPGPGWSEPTALTNVGGTLFFSAFHPSYGRELWKSDGTEAGTVLVKDINPSGSSGVFEAVDVNGTLFFSTSDGSGPELWKSDGTAEGTVMVKDINPTGYSRPQFLTNAYGALYFTADDGVHGRELWKSDGTEEGTVMVADINPGPGSGVGLNNGILTVVGELLFFQANDGETGTELWALDVVPPFDTGKIPAVSAWGMVALALLLVTAGTIAVTRRRSSGVPANETNGPSPGGASCGKRGGRGA